MLQVMKKIIVVFGLSMAIVLQGYAQDEVQENLPNVVKLNPIGLAFGNINLGYQRALAPAHAFQVSANYWYKIFGTEVSGFGIRGGYQFFLTSQTKEAPEGFYIGPQISYNSLNEKGTDVSVSAFGVGAMLGYQWIWNSGLCLDLGIGPVYQFANEKGGTETSYQGFLPNITIALGWNF
jgi:hypothetical protein